MEMNTHVRGWQQSQNGERDSCMLLTFAVQLVVCVQVSAQARTSQSLQTCCCCRTLALVKPDAFRHLGQILNAVYGSGFQIRCVLGFFIFVLLCLCLLPPLHLHEPLPSLIAGRIKALRHLQAIICGPVFRATFFFALHMPKL